jgi:hypothetical protein
MTLAARPSTVSQITAVRASLAAALVSGLVVAGGCSSSPRCPPGASCPMVIPRVMFTPTVNGQPAVLPKNGSPPRYHVRPGERLVVKVVVTVPRHFTITALWFGISTGVLGGGRTALAACTRSWLTTAIRCPRDRTSSGCAGVPRTVGQGPPFT